MAAKGLDGQFRVFTGPLQATLDNTKAFRAIYRNTTIMDEQLREERLAAEAILNITASREAIDEVSRAHGTLPKKPTENTAWPCEDKYYDCNQEVEEILIPLSPRISGSHVPPAATSVSHGRYVITAEDVMRALKEVGEIAIPPGSGRELSLPSVAGTLRCKYADPVETGVLVRQVSRPDLSNFQEEDAAAYLDCGYDVATSHYNNLAWSAFLEAKQVLKRKLREWPTCPHGGTVSADECDGRLVLMCDRCL